LSPWRPYCRPFASVEHSELKHCKIGRTAHDPTECVDFPDYRALCNSTDSGIAGHLSDCFQRARDEADFRADARGGDCGFSAGVTSANYQDIEIGFGWLNVRTTAHELKSSRIRVIVRADSP